MPDGNATRQVDRGMTAGLLPARVDNEHKDPSQIIIRHQSAAKA